MQVQSVGTKLYTYKAGGVKKAVQNPASIPSERKENEDKAKKKKILMGVGIAALTGLLLLLFRKKIFCRRGGGGTPESPKGQEGAGNPVTNGHNSNSHSVKPTNPTGTSENISSSEESFDAQALLKEYWDLCFKQKDIDTIKTKEETRIWHEQQEKIREIYNKLRTNNVSFVVKEEFDPNPTVDIDKKRAYFNSWKVARAKANEASKMDYLDMFEKYGDRYYNPKEPWNNTIANLGVIVDIPTDDKILSKYVDILDRIAIRDPQGLKDSTWIIGTFESTVHNMSENTILKFIKVMKRIAFQQREYNIAKYAVMRTEYKDSPRIKEALKGFEEAVKDYPYEL